MEPKPCNVSNLLPKQVGFLFTKAVIYSFFCMFLPEIRRIGQTFQVGSNGLKVCLTLPCRVPGEGLHCESAYCMSSLFSRMKSQLIFVSNYISLSYRTSSTDIKKKCQLWGNTGCPIYCVQFLYNTFAWIRLSGVSRSDWWSDTLSERLWGCCWCCCWLHTFSSNRRCLGRVEMYKKIFLIVVQI